MDGLEFLRQIKSNPDIQGIPIIILSTSSEQKTIDTAIGLGAAGFIIKPSNYYSLVEILKDYL